MKLCDSDSTECLLNEFSQRLSHYILNDDDYNSLCGIEKKENEMKKVVRSFLKQNLQTLEQ